MHFRQAAVMEGNSGFRGSLWAGTVLLGCALAAGCNSLAFFGHDRAVAPKKDESVPAAAAVVARPSRYCFRLAPYVFLSDFEIDRERPIFKGLTQLRDQIARELRLPTGGAVVEVYLFEDEARYRRYIKANLPDFPARRAFFRADPPTWGNGPDRLQVFAYWSDSIEKDLRHELTHALVHSVLRKVPLWLDEGLAEFFELPPERDGLNVDHVQQLRQSLFGTLKPDLTRLESFGQNDLDRMDRLAYQESWAWVHLMLRAQPEARKVLLDYLRYLRQLKNDSEEPASLRQRLLAVFPSPEEVLQNHLARLDDTATPKVRTGP